MNTPFVTIHDGELAATAASAAGPAGRRPRTIADVVTDHADAFAPIVQTA